MNSNPIIAFVNRTLCVLIIAWLVNGCSAPTLNQAGEKSQPLLYDTIEQAIIESPELKDWQPFTLTIVKKRTASHWISIVGGATKQTDDTASAKDRNQSNIQLVALLSRQADKAYRLVEISLGDSDAEFPEWIEEYSLPVELFYDTPPADNQWGLVNLPEVVKTAGRDLQ